MEMHLSCDDGTLKIASTVVYQLGLSAISGFVVGFALRKKGWTISENTMAQLTPQLG